METDAEVREIIRDYLITGNLEAFTCKINEYYKRVRGLKRWSR